MLLFVSTALGVSPEEVVRTTISAHLEVPEEDVDVLGLGSLAGLSDAEGCGVQLPRVGPIDGTVPIVLSCPSGRYPVRASIEVWRELPVAANDARPGELVPFVIERVPSARLHGEQPVSPEGTWRARTDIGVGDPLTTVRVAPAPDAPRGSPVTIVAGEGALLVTAEGELLQDAWLDRPVAVLNLSTRSVVDGTWRGGGLVVLEGP